MFVVKVSNIKTIPVIITDMVDMLSTMISFGKEALNDLCNLGRF